MIGLETNASKATNTLIDEFGERIPFEVPVSPAADDARGYAAWAHAIWFSGALTMDFFRRSSVWNR